MSPVDGYIRAQFLRRRFNALRDRDLADLMNRCATIFAGAMSVADINRIILSEGLE